MAGIISGLSALVTLASNLFSYFTKKDDQNTGRKLQAADDTVATVKGAEDAQVDRTRVEGLSHQQLVDGLRDPSGRNK